MDDNEYDVRSRESIELSGEDAMRMCSEQDARLSGEQRLLNAKVATSYEIMSYFRDMVILEWSMEDLFNARRRAMEAAAEQAAYAQWLRTEPTAAEVAAYITATAS